MGEKNLAKATLGGGCFWCTEAVYNRVKGVAKAVPGYSGGHTKDPTYEQVCAGKTGHAEVVQVTFDPRVISYREILEIFFATHDPTTLNRQGADVGTQYRSVILYHDEDQRRIAEALIAELEEDNVYSSPIITEVKPFEVFYEAEEYHHNYYERHKRQPYCNIVIAPKIGKLLKTYQDKLK
jgi:peptide-methionine (S)-S-oxide reductase